ncbi:hypothetical protein PENSOL_c008G07538, partial [Penicillium solitum]
MKASLSNDTAELHWSDNRVRALRVRNLTIYINDTVEFNFSNASASEETITGIRYLLLATKDS